MKLFTIILSVFILSSTLIPCSDALNSEDQEDVFCDHKHDHSEDTDDSCASICICTCCGVTITYELLKQFNVAIRTVIISKDDCIYQSDYTFYFFPNIWQPPRSIS
ncbi:DUF6660 family protein [uncultured Aquimarina sp.]|uniref:DUF6660 family protein n=1 Tax=uncultured Aquimarina sp. TaxID=575652 RepID=UPI00260997CA|nr:DUF6660 family protein [uncultured Aquimarina sp.]